MQKINAKLPIVLERGQKPLFLKIGTNVNQYMSAEGAVETSLSHEYYVCLSLLPKELQEKVKVAIQSILTSV